MGETGTNAAGGRIYASTGGISQSDFASIVENNVQYGGDEVHILSGVHGFPNGEMVPEPEFYESDVGRFGDIGRVTVHNVAEMTPQQISEVLQRPGTIIGGFCNSAACLEGL